MALYQATPSPPWERPWEVQHKNQPEDRPHKVPRKDSHSLGSTSYQTPGEYDSIDKELGREKVTEVLGRLLGRTE